MLNLTSSALKGFLALDPCDMRKSFSGRHTFASDKLQAATARAALFVFTNKCRNRTKLLYSDGTCTWVASKRLEKTASAGPLPADSANAKPCNSTSMAPTCAEPLSSLGMSAPNDMGNPFHVS